MRIHLILAGLWLCLGLAMLFPEVSGWQLRKIQVGDLQFSAGWIVLVMAGYNLARWYSVFSARSRRHEQNGIRDRWRRSERESGPPSGPDPNFDFGDPPPKR